jgi:hypothetical protein
MQGKLPVAYNKLLHIVHLVCSDIRRLAETASAKQVHDMADAIEFVPQVLMNWRDDALSTIRFVLVKLQYTYPDLGDKYTRILDMNSEDFISTYVSCPSDETDQDYLTFIHPPSGQGQRDAAH